MVSYIYLFLLSKPSLFFIDLFASSTSRRPLLFAFVQNHLSRLAHQLYLAQNLLNTITIYSPLLRRQSQQASATTIAASPFFPTYWHWLARRTSPTDTDSARDARRTHAKRPDSDRARFSSRVASVAVGVGRS